MKQNEVHEALKDVPEWDRDENYSLIQREFQFQDFSDAMVFVNKVAELAEEANHHPDICISYNTVVCMLTTHDVGGLTETDFDLAQQIGELVEEEGDGA